MNIFTALKLYFGAVAPAPIPEREIIMSIDPWMLACAVGAENCSIGINIGFDLWLKCSRDNWMPEVKNKVAASEADIVKDLRHFVAQNKEKSYRQVLREIQTDRGIEPSVILKPGDIITLPR